MYGGGGGVVYGISSVVVNRTKGDVSKIHEKVILNKLCNLSQLSYDSFHIMYGKQFC